MRNLSYPLGALLALLALLVSSSAFATTGEGGNASPEEMERPAGEGGGADGEGGDDAAGGIDIGRVYGSDGCNLASTPRAGVNAALALLGLAMASLAVRMQPRRARARSQSDRRRA